MIKKASLIGLPLLAIYATYTIINSNSSEHDASVDSQKMSSQSGANTNAHEIITQVAQSNGTQKNKKEDKSGSDNALTTPDKNPHFKTVSDRMEAMEKWIGKENFTAEEIAEAQKSDDLWELADTSDSEGMPLTEDEKNDGRQFFKVSPAKFASTLPGDTLKFDLPDSGDKFEVNIEQVGSPLKGIVTWSGAMNELGNELNSFSMTRGNNYYSGHINTPTNTYTFEVFGNKGWIHESGALFTGELNPVIEDPENESAHHSHQHTDVM